MCTPEISDYIKSRLSFPGVSIELDQSSYDGAFMAAQGWFLSHIGQEGVEEIASMSPLVAYTVPAACDYVTDVIFSDSSPAFGSVGYWEMGIPLMGIRGLGGSPLGRPGSLYDIVSSQQYLETTQRVLGVDRDWNYDRVTRKLTFSPTAGNGGRVVYRYIRREIDLDQLSSYELWILKEYALCQAMLTLGMGRSKYAALAGSEGDVTLNGSELMSQAEMMRGDLEEKIKTIKRPLPVITG